jgi:hypothetical protein
MPEFTLVDTCASLLIALAISEKFLIKNELMRRYLIGELTLLIVGILFLLSGFWLELSKSEMGGVRIMFLSCIYVFIIRLWRRFKSCHTGDIK